MSINLSNDAARNVLARHALAQFMVQSEMMTDLGVQALQDDMLKNAAKYHAEGEPVTALFYEEAANFCEGRLREMMLKDRP